MRASVVALGEVVDLRTGPFGSALHQHDYVTGGVPLINPTHIRDGRFYPDPTVAVGEKKFNELREFTLKVGDVVMGRRGEMGRCAVVTGAESGWLCGTGSIIVRPTPAIDQNFLQKFLSAPNTVRALEGDSVGTTMVNLNQKILLALKLPLPPLTEQRRIAAILDKADALRAKRREAIAKLHQLLQSVFLDMFGDPVSNPKGWAIYPLGEVADFHAGNSLPSGEEFTGQADGYLALKVSDMNLPGNEYEITSAAQWVSGDRKGAIQCPSGAVLFPKRGGAIGTNKKRVLTRPAYLDPNLMGVSAMPDRMNLVYLFHWFRRFNLSDIASGSSVPQLNKRDLAPLQIPLPPLSVQQEFERVVARLSAQVGLHKVGLGVFERLFGTLQQRAFAGTL